MKTLILNLLCNILLLQSCNKENTRQMTQENFPYAVTVYAPKEYPVEVHEGWLMDDKKQYICAMPRSGVEGGGWQYDGSKAGMGGSAMPSHINLTYVAYAEKKFYNLDADLPTDKILAAFRKGFLVQGNKKDDKGEYELEPSTYDTFSIGLAPGGMVVIFLGGSSRTEICRLQAKETFVDRNDFYRNPHELSQAGFFEEGFTLEVPDSIQTQIKERGLPYGLYDQYRKKYNYRFLFTPYDEKDVIKMQTNRYYNGEVIDFLQPEELAKKEYKSQGIPYNVEFIFKVYNTEIIFNDHEMLSVFDDLQRKHPDKPMDIIVKPTFEYTDFKLSVKCENEVIPLEKYKVKGVWGG